MQRKIVGRKIRRSLDDESQFDREFWKQAGHEARFAATWEMVDQVSLIRGGKRVSQSGLQRSVQNIQRRTS